VTRRSATALLLSPLMPGSEFRKIADGLVFADGPTCDRAGALYFSDVGAERIYRYRQGELRVVRNSSNVANGLVDDRGRLVVCERGRVTRTEADGRLTILTESYDGKGLHSPNDLVVARDGTIFFNDLKSSKEWKNPAKVGHSGVYRLSAAGELTLLARDCDSPNGVALTPRGDVLYVADTAGHAVYAYDPRAGGGCSPPWLRAKRRTG
jgi:gluconolactonase